MTVADLPLDLPLDIPFVDLASQHDEIAEEVEQGFRAVMKGTGFIGGPAGRRLRGGARPPGGADRTPSAWPTAPMPSS